MTLIEFLEDYVERVRDCQFGAHCECVCHDDLLASEASDLLTIFRDNEPVSDQKDTV